MSLKQNIKDVQKLNAEIKQAFRDLNRLDSPPIFKPEQIRSAQDFLDSLKQGINEVNVELNSIARSFRDSVNELSKQNTELGRAKSSLKSIANTASEIVYENSRGVLIEDKTLDKLQKKAKIQFESLKISILSGKIKGDQLKEAQAAIAQEEKFSNQLKEISRQQKLIKKDSGIKLFTGLESITNAIPGLKNLTGAFQEASEAAQKQGKFNLLNFDNVKGMTKAQEKQFQQKIEFQKKERQGDIATLQEGLKKGQLGKKINAELIDRLGLTEQLKDKNGEILEGSHAGARIQKLIKKGDIDLAKGKGLKSIAQLPKSISPLKAGFKALGPAIKKAFGPAFLLTELISALIQGDKAAGDLAKSMNMTYTDALRLRGEFSSIANSANDVFVNTKGVQETFMLINKTLGTNASINEDTLIQFTRLREVAGLTNEELMGIFKITQGTNKEIEQVTGEVLAQAQISAANLGVAINEKEVLRDINKLSAATTLSLGKNPRLLAEAVTVAKAFGMTMEQIASSSEALLNFEQSISNELKAELLLGKNINLERARLAALNNDIATVAKEISSQIGSAADFSNMNVIQQQALAESVGMSRDSLAETLFVQEQLRNVTGDEAAERKAVLDSLIHKKSG